MVCSLISVYSSLCFSILNLCLFLSLCDCLFVGLFLWSFLCPSLSLLFFPSWTLFSPELSLRALTLSWWKWQYMSLCSPCNPFHPNSLILELNLARTCMCIWFRSGEAGLTSWTMALSMGFVLESQCLLYYNGKLSTHFLNSLTFSYPICLLSIWLITFHHESVSNR